MTGPPPKAASFIFSSNTSRSKPCKKTLGLCTNTTAVFLARERTNGFGRLQLFERGGAWQAHWLIAVGRERAKNVLGVGGIARLHGDVELGALGRNI